MRATPRALGVSASALTLLVVAAVGLVKACRQAVKHVFAEWLPPHAQLTLWPCTADPQRDIHHGSKALTIRACQRLVTCLTNHEGSG